MLQVDLRCEYILLCSEDSKKSLANYFPAHPCRPERILNGLSGATLALPYPQNRMFSPTLKPLLYPSGRPVVSALPRAFDITHALGATPICQPNGTPICQPLCTHRCRLHVIEERLDPVLRVELKPSRAVVN